MGKRLYWNVEDEELSNIAVALLCKPVPEVGAELKKLIDEHVVIGINEYIKSITLGVSKQARITVSGDSPEDKYPDRSFDLLDLVWFEISTSRRKFDRELESEEEGITKAEFLNPLILRLERCLSEIDKELEK